MARKYIDLTIAQKAEIKRLTQLANRRIKSATKEYERAGKTIVPREIVGRENLQTRKEWFSKTMPVSRSVKFTSQAEYRRQMAFLKSFDPKVSGISARPTISEYRAIQYEKVLRAVETSIGLDASGVLEKKLGKLSAPELSTFWDKFSNNAARMGAQYSSDAVMEQTLTEFFDEDIYSLIDLE